VNVKTNDLVGNILQNKFCACCYTLLRGTSLKTIGHTPICGAAMLLCGQLVPKPYCCLLHWIVLTLPTLHLGITLVLADA